MLPEDDEDDQEEGYYYYYSSHINIERRIKKAYVQRTTFFLKRAHIFSFILLMLLLV